MDWKVQILEVRYFSTLESFLFRHYLKYINIMKYLLLYMFWVIRAKKENSKIANSCSNSSAEENIFSANHYIFIIEGPLIIFGSL